MGNVNAQSLPRLQKETQKGFYDLILHVGDFAYNLDTVQYYYLKRLCAYVIIIIFKDDGEVGDEFMRQIEPIAAYLPYMTCNGNHEQFK